MELTAQSLLSTRGTRNQWPLIASTIAANNKAGSRTRKCRRLMRMGGTATMSGTQILLKCRFARNPRPPPATRSCWLGVSSARGGGRPPQEGIELLLDGGIVGQGVVDVDLGHNFHGFAVEQRGLVD